MTREEIIAGMREQTVLKRLASLEEPGRVAAFNNLPVYVCLDPRASFQELWPQVKHYDWEGAGITEGADNRAGAPSGVRSVGHSYWARRRSPTLRSGR